MRCLLIEEQVDPRKLPKMERVNMRSMEMYRRMGLADAIRKAGAPETARMDSCIAISMAEAPLVRLEYQNPQYGGGAVEFTLPTKEGYAK